VNDYLWKGVLEDVFDDFLRFMHPNADEIFDFERGITFLDKELEQLFPPEKDEFSVKVIDKLAKLYTREGTEEWVLIHCEVQAKYSMTFRNGCTPIFIVFSTNSENVFLLMPF